MQVNGGRWIGCQGSLQSVTFSGWKGKVSPLASWLFFYREWEKAPEMPLAVFPWPGVGKNTRSVFTHWTGFVAPSYT